MRSSVATVTDHHRPLTLRNRRKARLIVSSPRRCRPLLAVNDLSRTLPECLPEAAGALMLPLLIMTDDAILWFRRELSQTILWGGDPGGACHR